jgi:hypothetical protein
LITRTVNTRGATSGDWLQPCSTASCALPEYTSALITAACSQCNPRSLASTPNTMA